MGIALIFIIMGLSALDSISTWLALFKLPDDLKAKEANTLMLKVINKNLVWATIGKQLVTLALILFVYFSHGEYTLRLVATLLGLVVLSNFYIYFGRRITRRKIQSPFFDLYKYTHLPEKYYFWFLMPVLLLIAIGINRIWM
jgi:hypothetical protein